MNIIKKIKDFLLLDDEAEEKFEAEMAEMAELGKKTRGRPKGSKNKRKGNITEKEKETQNATT